ncbi:hypothetical protein [Bradyrhizobium genosp. P]|uniref:hypothetical protein n=1 Tax=Bradyrhizobium genosp. P TaxID=83641 RepID=UPI003CEC58AC
MVFVIGQPRWIPLDGLPLRASVLHSRDIRGNTGGDAEIDAEIMLVDVSKRQRELQHQRRQRETGSASPGEGP